MSCEGRHQDYIIIMGKHCLANHGIQTVIPVAENSYPPGATQTCTKAMRTRKQLDDHNNGDDDGGGGGDRRR